METKIPQRVVKNINKCFYGISKLEFDTNQNIESIICCKDETIALIQPVSTLIAEGCVEKWLAQVF